MIVRTKEEYDEEQKRAKMLKEKHECPRCGSMNTEMTCLVHVREVPKPGILGKLGLSHNTIRSPEFECEECHTIFTVDALDRIY